MDTPDLCKQRKSEGFPLGGIGSTIGSVVGSSNGRSGPHPELRGFHAPKLVT